MILNYFIISLYFFLFVSPNRLIHTHWQLHQLILSSCLISPCPFISRLLKNFSMVFLPFSLRKFFHYSCENISFRALKIGVETQGKEFVDESIFSLWKFWLVKLPTVWIFQIFLCVNINPPFLEHQPFPIAKFFSIEIIFFITDGNLTFFSWTKKTTKFDHRKGLKSISL